MSLSLRLLLVDAPTLHRRCLAAFLSRRRGIRIIGETGNGRKAVCQAQSLRPDVVLVEPEVPDGGPQLVASLSGAAPGIAVLVLTLGSDNRSARHMLLAGARGYLRKDCEPQDIVRAIERVRAGELVLGPGTSDSLLRELDGEHPRGSALDGLSGRELEVLHLITEGSTNPEIARGLYITENTVKGHVTKILGKLALENRVQLATYALRHELAPPAAT
jgi:DNA-binding NarL/FixJ family response regulator